MPVVTTTSGTVSRRRPGLRAGRPHGTSSSRASLPLPKPLRWYVDWVRANEENAQSLERLSRTFAMIVSDPSDLVKMEGCWTISKMHSFVNEAILQTATRAVTGSELLTYILKAIQELEGLSELLIRCRCTQHTTWNILLALQSVKCVLNMCVHHHLFLMPWVWHSVRLYLRRVLRALWLPRYFITGRRKKSASGRGGESGNAVTNVLQGQAVGPRGARLVIPRVVSSRRGEHQHYFNPRQDLGNRGEGVEQEEEAAEAEEDSEDTAWEREKAEAVPFTFIDVLGMVVDAFLLVRPVLVVAAARHAFPAVGAEDIARVPAPPRPAPTQASTSEKSASAGATEKTDAAAPAATEKPPTQAPLSKAEKQRAAEQAALDNFPVLRATMNASSAQQTLFSSWKWWSLFAAVDAFVVLAARYIRAHRVPVIYMDESATTAQSLLLLENTNGHIHSSGASEAGGDRSVADGEDDGAGREDEGPATAEPVVTGSTTVVTSNVPAVVSRDSLRVQQAMRNMGYTFLRDPFFTIVLKQFIYNHFVNGFINKIPLLGSLIAFQVGYFLSMQHYSFLYSLGQ